MLALIIAGILQPARAQAPASEAQRDKHLPAIMAVIVLVEALAERCNTLEPASRQSREAALKKWRTANRIDALQALLAPLLARLRPEAAKHAAKLMGAKSGVCQAFAAELAEKDMAIGDKIAAILPALTQAKKTSPSSEPEAKPATVYTILQLSTLAEAAMSTFTGPEGASERKIRDAKAEVGKAALAKLYIIGVRARVVDRDHLEDWRGEYHSTYRVRCSAFVDKVAEDRIKALEGTETVIGGWVSDLHLHPGGGSITFKKCGFLDDRQLISSGLLERGGLKIRPPSAAEAHAGPGKGIQLRDVENVVYKLDQNMNINAVGGGFSMDRREDTYILLKDGTAYRHHWPFPFMDLNIDVVKRRDASSWFRWRQDGKDLLLTDAGGDYDGRTATLSGHVALAPFPAGERLNKAFQFMHVSGVGVRQERDYVFHCDGTVELYRSSLFAGQALGGGAKVAVTGPGAAYHGGGPNPSMLAIGPSSRQRACYKIDGYVLELTFDDGAVERRFIARFGDDKADDPGSLYLNGQLLWDRDKQDDARRQ